MTISKISRNLGLHSLNPFDNQGPAVQKVKYVAYAAIGLGLAVAAMYVAHPIPLILAGINAGLALRNTYIYYRDNPLEFQEDVRFIKMVAYRILGVFSKSFSRKADVLNMTKEPRQPLPLKTRVMNAFLAAASLSLAVASFATPLNVSNIVACANAGVACIRWINQAYFRPQIQQLQEAV